MMRLLHSNWFCVLSVAVIFAWLVALRPDVTITINECPYRVSARGIVHGPDSPFWGLTSPDPCFRSKSAARAYARGSE